jgi:hypothetical protein
LAYRNVESNVISEVPVTEIPLQKDDNDQDANILDHCWDSDNKLICTLFDRVVKYDIVSTQVSDTILYDPKLSPQRVSLTKNHIVAIMKVSTFAIVFYTLLGWQSDVDISAARAHCGSCHGTW